MEIIMESSTHLLEREEDPPPPYPTSRDNSTQTYPTFNINRGDNQNLNRERLIQRQIFYNEICGAICPYGLLLCIFIILLQIFLCLTICKKQCPTRIDNIIESANCI